MSMTLICFLLQCLLMSSISAQSCSSNDSSCLLACDIPSNSNHLIWTINDSQDINALTSQNCNFINGSISITANYSGRFVLPGIRAIAGQLKADGHTHEPLQDLSAILTPDLLTLGRLFVRDSPNLLTISMPNVQNITSLELEILGPTDMNFTNLVNASDIIISGPVENMDFDSLANVNSSLEISSSNTFEDLSAYGYNTTDFFPPLEIRFPSLVNATGINISGNISDLYIPLLQTASNGHLSNGIVVETYGSPIDIKFPKLDTLKDIALAGTMRSISLPSLQYIPGHISIEAATPISLNFSSLVNVREMNIVGNVTGIVLPSLKNITTLSISSKLPLSCSTTHKMFESIRGSTSGYTCSSFDNPSHLSTGAKIGIGIGSAAAACLILVCLLCFCLRMKRNSVVSKEPTSVHELQDWQRRRVDHGNDPPPAYSSRAGTDIGSTHSDDTIAEGAEPGPTATRRTVDGATAEEERTPE